MVNNLLRQYAEETFKSELDALISSDRNEKPTNWLLSPTAVRTYILGGTLPDGSEIEPKYFGFSCHRQGPSFGRDSGNCQNMGLRTFMCSYQREFKIDCPGFLRYWGGTF